MHAVFALLAVFVEDGEGDGVQALGEGVGDEGGLAAAADGALQRPLEVAGPGELEPLGGGGEVEGLAPEEVERYVTFPVETSMNGLPRLREVRSTSNFGLSVVNIYFYGMLLEALQLTALGIDFIFRNRE